MMVHLCEKHRNEWDSADEGTILGRMRTLSALPEDRQRRCINGDCRAKIGYPLFHLCVQCATRDRLCQQCSRSTLTEPELAEARKREEKEKLFDDAVDLYTLAVKTYGISAARALLMKEAPWDGELLNRVLRLGHRELDYGRELRPIWRNVLGKDVYRSRWCGDCPPPPRSEPGLVEAGCGHLTVGSVAASCPLCAADERACERCGESV